MHISGGSRGDVYCDYMLKSGKGRRPKEVNGKCTAFDNRKKINRQKNMDYIFIDKEMFNDNY